MDANEVGVFGGMTHLCSAITVELSGQLGIRG